MSTFYVDNAITWVQFRLKGGWKGLFITAAAYALLAGLAIFFSVETNGRGPVVPVMRGWATMLMVVQCGILILFAGSRVMAAVKRDVTSGVIESHRLMPLAAGEAVAGYIVGSASQALVLAATTFVVGVAVVAAGKLDVARWALCNAMLLTFAVFTWVIAAAGALAGRAGGALVFAVCMFTVMSRGMLLAIAPGLMVVTGPLVGRTIFDLSGSGGQIPPGCVIALAAQLLVGAICFAAGARKYRKADALAFPPWLALALLWAAALASAIGFAQWAVFSPDFMARRMDVTREVQATASALGLMLLCGLPLGAAARAGLMWRDSCAAGGPTTRAGRAPLGVVPTAALSAAAVAAFVLAAPPPLWDASLLAHVARWPFAAEVVAGVVAYVAGLAAWMQVLLPRVKRVNLTLGLWTALVWLGPPFADYVLFRADADVYADYTMGPVAAASPVASFYLVWSGSSVRRTPGLGVQLALAAVPLLVAFALRRRTKDAIGVERPGAPEITAEA